MNFSTLPLSENILKAIADAGYTTATPIQQQTIPQIIEGKDVLGCAQTGTGKTAAFAIPILQKLSRQKASKHIKSLVLTPTRELALQIEENCHTYSKYTNLKACAIFGGVPQGKQVASMKKGCDILIATPGRLLDLVNQHLVDLSQVEILVLDEADHMLDMGFINDVKKIVALTPQKRQTLFFSATMPKAIKKFAFSILQDPVEVTVTPVASTANTVQQSLYYVEKKEKPALLVQLIKAKSKQRSLVFTRTKHGADKLVKQLAKNGLPAAAIHGNKSQNARQRALDQFKNETLNILVATDIAARGIDIDALPLVVNYELPNVPETYVHRIGRTGRAGKDGIAISFCDAEQKDELRDIQKLIGFQIPVSATINNGRELIKHKN
jgi:ATP-dependent RNA helicase RhlE